jgi:hypothetical protein
MVMLDKWSRTLAVEFLKSCILNTNDSTNGLVIDEPDNDNVKVYLFNQCALVATALKLAGVPEWDRVTNATNMWINNNQSKINQYPIRNSLYPILDKSLVPVCASYLPNVDVVIYTDGPGTNTRPSQILTNTAPSDDLTIDVSKLSSNRGLLRVVHHIKNDNFTRARGDFDWIMSHKIADDGFAITDNNDVRDDGVRRYKVGKQLLQWIAAYYLGRPRIRPDILNKMQQDTGKLQQFFYYNNGKVDIRGTHGNTEVTALAVITDIIVNGGGPN